MAEWRITGGDRIELDDPITSAHLRLVGGTVDVVTTDGPAQVEVEVRSGPPVVVRLDAGVLRVGYDDVRWEGVLGWLRMGARHGRRDARVSLALPVGTAVQLGVISAGATVAGFTAPAQVRAVSSTVVLDDLPGGVTGETVSGDLQLRGVGGRVRLRSVSGSLTVVSGTPTSLAAETVSGEITLDLLPGPTAEVETTTVSGDVLVRAPLAALGTVRVTSTSGAIEAPGGTLVVERSPGRLRAHLDGDGPTRLSGTTVSGRVVLLDRPGPA